MRNIHNIFTDVLNNYKRLKYIILEDCALSETTHKYLIFIHLNNQLNKYFMVELLYYKDTDSIAGSLLENHINYGVVERFMNELIDAC